MDLGPASGGVLVIVLVSVLVFSTLGLGLLSQVQHNGIEAARRIQSTQAFWTAEGGIHQAVCRLDRDVAYRLSPTPLSGTLGNLPYDVSVSKSGLMFDVRSIGTAAAWKRTVELSLEFVPSVSMVDTNDLLVVLNWQEQ